MEADKQLDIYQGKTFSLHGCSYHVVGRLDMSHVLARSTDGKISKPIPIIELHDEIRRQNDDKQTKRTIPALELIEKDQWEQMTLRQELILKVQDGVLSSQVAAESLSVTPRHLNVLIDKYEKLGIEGLIIRKPTGGVNKSRTTDDQERILLDVLQEKYLTKQKESPAEVYREVKRRCNAVEPAITPPARSTVYRRCHSIDEQEKERKRKGSKAHKNKFSQTLDGYHDATRPLEIIQIDHTLMDIIVVDEETRQPIGRPWLTIAIDVYSRMVYGFYISLDPPSAMSVALCLQQAICRKEQWLADRGINHSWDIYGMLEVLHMDNGKDFQSKTLRRGCVKHEINMQYRLIGNPEHGAHIERLIGTFMTYMKVLPGTTFSNIQEKGDYDSEAESVMTLREVEKWFGTLVTGRYHKEVHSSLHMNPEQKFIEGLQGCVNIPSAGVNRFNYDENEILMDFTPYFEPTVQNYGIRIDHIHYNSSELKPFVNAIDKKTNKKQKFLVRRDPRDISVVYFFHPTENRYIPIPYRNKTRPPISLFEHRHALKTLKERGKLDSVTEDEIFRTLNELQQIVEESVKKTKKARRSSERKKLHRAMTESKSHSSKPDFTDIDATPVDEEVVPFTEIEIL